MQLYPERNTAIILYAGLAGKLAIFEISQKVEGDLCAGEIGLHTSTGEIAVLHIHLSKPLLLNLQTAGILSQTKGVLIIES